jgi:hypothetical protein
MKVSSRSSRVAPPKTTTNPRLTQSMVSTLRWRCQTQAIWAMVATITTAVAT